MTRTARRSAALGLLAVAVVASACSTVPGGAGRSLWRPSTWLGGDLTSDRRDATATADDRRAKLLTGAHAQTVAAASALATEPTPTQATTAATELLTGAIGDLDRAIGPLPADRADDARDLGRELATAQGRALENARARLEELREEQVKVAERLARAEAERAAVADRLEDAYRREAELADQVRRLWGILGIVAVVLVAGSILVPGFGAAALFVIRRLRSTVRQVVTAVEDYRLEHPVEAERLKANLSRRMDEAGKALVRTVRAEIAP